MKPEHYFFLAVAALIIIVIRLLIINGKTKPRFIYYIHRKGFNKYDADIYYNKLKERGIKKVYLMVYDTVLNEYKYKGDYENYLKLHITFKDDEKNNS
jgi:hypothetical protein